MLWCFLTTNSAYLWPSEGLKQSTYWIYEGQTKQRTYWRLQCKRVIVQWKWNQILKAQLVDIVWPRGAMSCMWFSDPNSQKTKRSFGHPYAFGRSALRVLLHYKILSFLGLANSYDVGLTAGLGIFKIGSLQLSQQWLKVKICQILSFFGLSKSKAFTRQKITSKFLL